MKHLTDACEALGVDVSLVLAHRMRTPNPDRDRVVYWLTDHDRTSTEIAEMLGMTRQAVRAAYHRGTPEHVVVRPRYCEDCGALSMGGGRWCYADFRKRQQSGLLSTEKGKVDA